MRKLTAIFLILMLVFTATVMAKKVKRYVEVEEEEIELMTDNVISTNILQWALLQFNAGYERKLTSNLSLKVRGFYSSLSNSGWSFFGLGGDLRFYPGGEACYGWYIRPHYDAWIVTYSETVLDEEITGNGVLSFLGAQVGHQWIFDGGFAMSVGLGYMTNISTSITYNDDSADVDMPFEGWAIPTIDFNLGYAF